MLPMFQTITGCDTVSFLAGKGKGRTWKVWQTYPETKPVFPSLFSGPGVLDESFCSHKDASLCFCRTRPAEWWRLMNQDNSSFSNGARGLKIIPPTQTALKHNLRPASQLLCTRDLVKVYRKEAKTSRFHGIGMAKRQTFETCFTWACWIAFRGKKWRWQWIATWLSLWTTLEQAGPFLLRATSLFCKQYCHSALKPI